MLFEQVKLTAEKCHAIIHRVFIKAAAKPDAEPSSSVPIPVLEAHGALDHRVRYLCEARAQQYKFNRERVRAIRLVEKSLDQLPNLIIEGLQKGPDENWLQVYKKLIQLHEGILKARLCDEVEEYEALLQQVILLADEISKASLIEVNASSMFALLLMQVHIQNDLTSKNPTKRSRPRKRKPKHKTGTRHPYSTGTSPQDVQA